MSAFPCRSFEFLLLYAPLSLGNGLREFFHNVRIIVGIALCEMEYRLFKLNCLGSSVDFWLLFHGCFLHGCKILFFFGAVMLYQGNMSKDDPLKDKGGEPLEGSGFEDETPEPEFSESDTPGETPKPAPHE